MVTEEADQVPIQSLSLPAAARRHYNPSLHDLSIDVFYQEVKEVLLQARRDIDETDFGAEMRLMGHNFFQSMKTYEETFNAMQVLNSAGQLQRPPRKRKTGPSEAKAETVGPSETTRFLRANSTSWTPGSDSMQEIWNHLEIRLEKYAQWLSGLLEHPDVSSLVAEAGILMDSLNARQQQYTCTIDEIAEICQSHRAATQELMNLQASNLRLHKFSAEPEMAASANEAAKAAAELSQRRLDVTEARLFAFHYTSDSISALKKVARHLTAAEKDAEESHAQITAKLQQYESQGQEFIALAKEIRKLERRIADSSHDLRELQEEGRIAQFTP